MCKVSILGRFGGAHAVALATVMQAMTTSALGAPIQWGVNGHYYEVVHEIMDWNQARVAAASRTHLGMTGHLLTVTDAEESLFVTAAFGAQNLQSIFLGGYQLPSSIEAAGGWNWVTGEAFTFWGWSTGEPNDSQGLENVTIFDHLEQPWGKPWNDVPDFSLGNGYVVEYEVPGPGVWGMGVASLVLWRRRVRGE